MKHTIALLAVIAFIAVVPINAGEKKTDITKVKIGISVGHLQEERWQREIDMFRAYAEEQGFKVLVQSAEQNINNQIKTV